MEEIKSVRVKRILQESVTFGGVDLSGSQFDIKITLYDDGNKKSVIGLNADARNVWDKIEYRKRGRYSDYTDDGLIRDFIDINSKREGSEFEISQDPFLEKPPKERSFGFDPYYLNNGAKILIKWLDGNFSVGGKGWSDLNGNELDIQKGQTQSTKGFIDKTAQVLASDSYEGENKILTYTSLGLSSYSEMDNNNLSPLVSVGRVKDVDIINQIISFWKTKVPNYDNLALCDPNNEFCEFVDFINPVDTLEQSDPVQDNVLKSTDTIADGKINLSFVIDSSISIKVREDFDFKIHIGEPPVDPLLSGFDFGDSDQDLSLLDDEFIEAEFQGDGEGLLSLEEQTKEEKQAKKDLENSGIPAVNINIPQGTYIVSNIAVSTPFGSTSQYSPSFNSVPIYSQYDTRWSTTLFDYQTDRNGKVKSCGLDQKDGTAKATVATSGCGPTAVSMVINFWASKGYCKPTLPSAVARFFSDFGGRVCNQGSALGQVPKDKFKETFGLVLKTSATDDSLFKSLQNGYPCVIAGKNFKAYNFKGNVLSNKYLKGHFICLTGVDNNGLIRINDSGNGPTGGASITAFITKGKEALSKDIGSISQKALIYPEALSNTIV